MWWHTHVIPALRRWNKEEQKVEARFDDIESWELAWEARHPIQTSKRTVTSDLRKLLCQRLQKEKLNQSMSIHTKLSWEGRNHGKGGMGLIAKDSGCGQKRAALYRLLEWPEVWKFLLVIRMVFLIVSWVWWGMPTIPAVPDK